MTQLHEPALATRTGLLLLGAAVVLALGLGVIFAPGNPAPNTGSEPLRAAAPAQPATLKEVAMPLTAPSRPPLDLQVPQVLETATFALG